MTNTPYTGRMGNEPCPWCKSTEHNSVECPRVRVIEFYSNGNCSRGAFHDTRTGPRYDPAKIRKVDCPSRAQ